MATKWQKLSQNINYVDFIDSCAIKFAVILKVDLKKH